MLKEIIEKKRKELIKNNFLELRKNLFSDEYQLKVKNYCQLYGFNIDDLNNQIMCNDYVASYFIKNPLKQNYIEKIVADLLNTKTLPQSGKNAIRFNDNGEITNKKEINTTKSADFKINNTYITQKYTKDCGGSQDNQYNDVVSFLIKGSIKHYVAAILDGDFWDSKRDELKQYFQNNSKVKIFSVDEILQGGIVFD